MIIEEEQAHNMFSRRVEGEWSGISVDANRLTNTLGFPKPVPSR